MSLIFGAIPFLTVKELRTRVLRAVLLWLLYLFNTGLFRPAYSTIFFGKLVFRLSVLSVFVLNQMF